MNGPTVIKMFSFMLRCKWYMEHKRKGSFPGHTLLFCYMDEEWGKNNRASILLTEPSTLTRNVNWSHIKQRFWHWGTVTSWPLGPVPGSLVWQSMHELLQLCDTLLSLHVRNGRQQLIRHSTKWLVHVTPSKLLKSVNIKFFPFHFFIFIAVNLPCWYY